MKERPIIFSAEMVQAILSSTKTQTRRIIKPQPSKYVRWGEHYDSMDGDVVEACGLKPDQWAFWAKVNVGDYGGPPTETTFDMATKCPYGKPGDHLWVKESAYISPPDWCKRHDASHIDPDDRPRVVDYVATMKEEWCAIEYGIKKTPSIFMPRWASRIDLRITRIRPQRLQDISEDDAAAEGIERHSGPYILDFARLWDQINGKRKGCSWKENPWVWIIEFKRIEQ